MYISPNIAPPSEPDPVESPRGTLTLRPIVIESRATLVVGLGMLLAGIVVGILLRPLLPLPGSANAPGAPLAASVDGAAGPAPTTAGRLTGPAATSEAATQAADVMQLIVGRTRHFKGNPEARVVMVEFADFQCPYCGHYASDAEPKVDSAYVDTGQVRFGYQHFAFLGDESIWAAEASECANDQEAFWPYHDLLFASQAGENKGAFSKANLKKFAMELKLDAVQFDNCLDTEKYASLVQDETNAAESIGVRSTPTFVINGHALQGAQPFEVFQRIFQEALGPS